MTICHRNVYSFVCTCSHTHTRTHTLHCVYYFTTITTILSYLPLFTLFLTVRPDPPVSLNWTLLDISPSGLNYDVMVNWEPPPTADIKGGWMQIVYEIQYRDRNTTNWEKVSLSFFFFSLPLLLPEQFCTHSHTQCSTNMMFPLEVRHVA